MVASRRRLRHWVRQHRLIIPRESGTTTTAVKLPEVSIGGAVARRMSAGAKGRGGGEERGEEEEWGKVDEQEEKEEEEGWLGEEEGEEEV